MVLEALALEVLHRIGFTVGRAHLLIFLGERVSEEPEATMALPVFVEHSLQGMSGGLKIDARWRVGTGRSHSLEGRIVDARLARLRRRPRLPARLRGGCWL